MRWTTGRTWILHHRDGRCEGVRWSPASQFLVDPQRGRRVCLLPAQMQVILRPSSNRSFWIYIHTVLPLGQPPNSLVNEVRASLRRSGDHRCRDDLGALGNLAECNEPSYDVFSEGRKEIRD